jgi:hypothetical protein
MDEHFEQLFGRYAELGRVPARLPDIKPATVPSTAFAVPTGVAL